MMEDDPTGILMQQINAVPEESKIAPSSQVDNKNFMAMAADSNQDEAQAASDPAEENLTTSDLLNKEILLAKHKSYTPMPRKRSHANSQAVGGSRDPRKPFILGVSTN